MMIYSLQPLEPRRAHRLFATWRDATNTEKQSDEEAAHADDDCCAKRDGGTSFHTRGVYMAVVRLMLAADGATMMLPMRLRRWPRLFSISRC